MVRKLTGKCVICGRKVYSKNSCYCLRCFEFVRRMDQRGVHAVAVKHILNHVHQNGFICEYTGIRLNMINPKSPLYYEFDHLVPGDGRKMRLTCALFNELKGVLSLKEFWNINGQLTDYHRQGKKIKMIKLAYWTKRGPHLKAILLNLARVLKKKQKGSI